VTICTASSISSYQPDAPGKLDAFLGNPLGILSAIDGQLLQQLEEIQPADATT
jgi:hypothetical protein